MPNCTDNEHPDKRQTVNLSELHGSVGNGNGFQIIY